MAIFIAFLGVAYMINRTFTLNFWDPGYQLKADFVDADGIANASDIRVNGVYVGQVTEIRSINGGLAEITFRLDPEHSPMHDGTRANLRLQTLLGQKFIELTPGPRDAALLSANTIIPSNKTTSPVDFDQLLSTFDKPTRDSIQKLIQEGGIATDGRGQDINGLLADLNQLSVQSAPPLETFSDRGDHVNNILINAADVTQNLSDNRQHLASTLTNLNAILATISANDPAFRKFLHEGNLSLGHGIAQFDGNTQNFNDTVRLLRTTLHTANPALEDLTTIDRSFQSFIDVAKVFSGDILSSVSGYNANALNASCNSPGYSAGCGGPYLRQPTILVQNPANVRDCERAAPAGPGCPAAPAAAAPAGAPPVAASSALPPLPLNLGGLSPGLNNLLPGLIPGILGGSGSPAPSQDAISSLLNFLLGH
jgi:virulence factor Mce-like protein